MKTRYLQVTMPDKSMWDIPAEVIERDNGSMLSDEDLIDWAQNNMNWCDVERSAIRISPPCAPDFQEGWVNGYAKVIERHP